MPLLSEIIGNYVELTDYTNSEKTGICPFHDNHTLGKFLVNDNKNIWKCFSCGASPKGNPKISFLMQLLDISEKEAQRILEKEYFEKYSYNKTNKNIFDTSKINLNMDLLDKVYSVIFQYAVLKPQDKQYLANRGITDFGDYISFPLSNQIKKKILENIQYLLSDNFMVPGFYFDEYTNQWQISNFYGIGIKICNAAKQIAGIHIRLYEKKQPILEKQKKVKQSKYVWFSSSKQANSLSYSNGCGNVSPVEVIYPKTVKKIYTVVITEGHFKAKRLVKEGYIAVSVSGVTHWKKVKYVLNEIAENYEIKKVYIAYDADFIENNGVFQCLQHLVNDLSSSFSIFILYWNIRYGKGIDDLMEREDYLNYLFVLKPRVFFEQFHSSKDRKGVG